MSKRGLKPDEKRAWARVAKTVRPRADVTPPDMPSLDELALGEIRSNPAKSGQNPTKPGSYPTAYPTPSPLTKPSKAPVQNRGRERRVRRGQAEIAATLDLHGMTQEAAQLALISFLKQHRAMQSGCVLVITGKGRAGEGILRKRLVQWLGTGEARGLVNGYAEAHRKHGGSGAWYLFLRKTDKKQ